MAVAELIAGQQSHVNLETVPVGDLHVAGDRVGGSQRAGAEGGGRGLPFGQFPFIANGRARSLGETNGFIKILADAESDRILGVHIIGPFASELIAEATVAMEFGASSEDIARIVHAHPSLSEVMHEAALRRRPAPCTSDVGRRHGPVRQSPRLNGPANSANPVATDSAHPPGAEGSVGDWIRQQAIVHGFELDDARQAVLPCLERLFQDPDRRRTCERSVAAPLRQQAPGAGTLPLGWRRARRRLSHGQLFRGRAGQTQAAPALPPLHAGRSPRARDAAGSARSARDGGEAPGAHDETPLPGRISGHRYRRCDADATPTGGAASPKAWCW